MSDKQSNESFIQHSVPFRPWEKVGTDIFTLEDGNYSVTVDYFSNFIEVDFLRDTV